MIYRFIKPLRFQCCEMLLKQFEVKPLEHSSGFFCYFKRHIKGGQIPFERSKKNCYGTSEKQFV